MSKVSSGSLRLSGSSEMGFPWRAISAFTFTFCSTCNVADLRPTLSHQHLAAPAAADVEDVEDVDDARWQAVDC